MPRTNQQQAVIDAALDPSIDLIKVKAIAGSGKTYTLVELSKELNPTKGLYLAYNKAIAEEAGQKFKGTNIKCSTIHSLAYSSVVRQYGLKVGYFGVRNVQPTSLRYNDKLTIVNTLDDFFLSEYVDIYQYFEDKGTNLSVQDACMNNLNLMTTGAIQCSHSFYLKLYHIYMSNGTVEAPNVDLLLLDEFGDITGLTLDIFRLIKAKKKIAVGDPMQNIYSFNKTINGFDVLAGEGVDIGLTESFRVSDIIASQIEGFVQTTMEPGFEFQGRAYNIYDPVTTKAYIARNNSGLMEEMFRLQDSNQPFHTTRKIGLILELPLILANLSNGQAIADYKYKHIEKFRKSYETNSALQTKHGSINAYVRSMLKEDEDISRAFKVVMNHGPRQLNALAAYATVCSKVPCDLTLTTAHSSKGLEFSSVEIAPDLNESVSKAMYDIRKAMIEFEGEERKVVVEALREELRLYYVSCSRSMIELINASHLPKGLIR